jgi:hypothetical protein
MPTKRVDTLPRTERFAKLDWPAAGMTLRLASALVTRYGSWPNGRQPRDPRLVEQRFRRCLYEPGFTSTGRTEEQQVGIFPQEAGR